MFISYFVGGDLLVPRGCLWQLFEFKAQKLLIYLKSLFFYMFCWKILLQFVFIKIINFLFIYIGIVSKVPRIPFGLWIFSLFSLHFQESFHFLSTHARYTVRQIILELLNHHGALGHPWFKDHFGIARISEHQGQLVSLLHQLFYYWNILFFIFNSICKVNLFPC